MSAVNPSDLSRKPNISTFIAVAKDNVRLAGRRSGGPPHFGQRRAVKPSFGSPSDRRSDTVKYFGNWYRMSGTLAAIILILTGSLVGAAPSPEIPSFVKTCRALEKLSKDAGGNAEGWKWVIGSFLTIHETSKDHRLANRSLFLAGKASLDLYRRSGRVEDLDEAIRHLSRFSDLNRRGRNLILGLRELKEAHSLKRKTLDHPIRTADAAPGANPGRTGPQGFSWQAHAQAASKDQQKAIADRSPKSFPLAPDSVPANALPEPVLKVTTREPSPPVKSASLPPPIINAGPGTAKVASPVSREFVVAIDPGHGGKDPGAVSADGRLKEKNLTLEIATMLKMTLESKNPTLKVVLTRSDDRHLSLEERIAIANSANADLFISIHCNSAADASSKGIETYYFSKASSGAAMKAAARENGLPLSKMSDVEATLLDLMVTSKKSESAKLAISVHSALSRSQRKAGTTARDRGVRQAPFYVLLGAKMPAILVECAFISNKRERGKLTSPEYVASIADKIADGAANYVKGLDSQG
jgi:N-acetylmuramoyl-L-alanine amidase